MDTAALQAKATDIRKDILTMITEAGSGHPGGSLSCTDILTALYFGGVMDYNPADPHKPGRDRFILAKGHAAPALYATLAHAGFFPTDELHTLRKLGTRLQGHPDSNLLPGVEVSTGSLGQGLSVAAGLAAGLRLTGEDGLVFTVLGDGECEEGRVEAICSPPIRSSRLVAIIDNNELQIDGCIHDVCDPGDLGEKFAAFGWDVQRVCGHDIPALVELFGRIKAEAADTARPVCVIARTVKGKGVSFMENQAGWHGKAPKSEELEKALAELSADAE
ncbi:MAG: transketolase [Coriobacteriaceae bacterium]